VLSTSGKWEYLIQIKVNIFTFHYASNVHKKLDMDQSEIFLSVFERIDKFIIKQIKFPIMELYYASIAFYCFSHVEFGDFKIAGVVYKKSLFYILSYDICFNYSSKDCC